MNNESVYFGAIGYELGEIISLDEYFPIRESKDVINNFKKNGLENIAVSPLDSNLLALKACQKTLNKANIKGENIDAIIYASTSHWYPNISNESTINWLMNCLDIKHGFPIGIYLPGCANFSVALRIAKNLIIADKLQNVLIVTSDKANPADPESRVFYPDITLLSDGAASCIVSSDNKFEYRIIDIEHHSEPAIWDIDLVKNYSAFLLETVKGSKKAVDKIFDSNSISREDIKLLILNNFNIPTMKMLTKQNGFEEKIVYMKNMQKFAHSFTADSLINLCDADKECVKNDYILMLAAGTKNWGVILIQNNEE